ncbi:hypothetical protein KPH14_006845 [Odynerus spinipes]|uniref:Uncharacterized protein n=1 Tax=Odynerus spinipes TaxID=1348599 RepID=A0AAD9RRV2_9HYME|nr:hypothetical protein KPH14_006845 [Odynerus spinipes]
MQRVESLSRNEIDIAVGNFRALSCDGKANRFESHGDVKKKTRRKVHRESEKEEEGSCHRIYSNASCIITRKKVRNNSPYRSTSVCVCVCVASIRDDYYPSHRKFITITPIVTNIGEIVLFINYLVETSNVRMTNSEVRGNDLGQTS